MAAKPDAVFYSGYYAEAAPVRPAAGQQGLHRFTSSGPDGTKDPAFIQQARQRVVQRGPSPARATDGLFDPDVRGRLREGQQRQPRPGTYSLEGYGRGDRPCLQGHRRGATTDRASLLNYVKNYNGNGLSKHLQWNLQR